MSTGCLQEAEGSLQEAEGSLQEAEGSEGGLRGRFGSLGLQLWLTNDDGREMMPAMSFWTQTFGSSMTTARVNGAVSGDPCGYCLVLIQFQIATESFV